MTIPAGDLRKLAKNALAMMGELARGLRDLFVVGVELGWGVVGDVRIHEMDPEHELLIVVAIEPPLGELLDHGSGVVEGLLLSLLRREARQGIFVFVRLYHRWAGMW
jgi:hypothetical protein